MFNTPTVACHKALGMFNIGGRGQLQYQGRRLNWPCLCLRGSCNAEADGKAEAEMETEAA